MSSPNKIYVNKQSFSNRVVQSVSWLAAFQIIDNVLGIVRLIVLARLLSPVAFGLVGVAWLTLQVLNTFTQSGMNQSLIYKQKIDTMLNAGWTFQILRGVALFIILQLLAPFVGIFFNSQEAVPVIQALGFTLLLDGFTNIGVIYFQKDLDFSKQFKLNAAGNVTDAVITIIFAFILQNVWAIVFGALANSIVRLILSYTLSNYRPRLSWNFSYIKEMFHYGKWIGGSSILQFIYSQGDDLLVGRLLGVTSLGYYQLAYRISNLPATQITHIISTVMFPAYSKIQSSISSVRRVYIVNLQIISFLSFLIGTLIILFANDFTILFLGTQWLPIVLAMQMLTLWGVIRSVGATTGPVWQALGSPKTVTKIQTFQVAILLIVIYPLTTLYGIVGTSIAVVLSAFIPNIVTIKLIAKTLEVSVSKVLSCLGYPFAASIFVAIIFTLLKGFYPDVNYLSFTVLAVICIFAYVASTLLFSKYLNYQFYILSAELVEKSKYANIYRKYSKKLEGLYK